MGEHLLSGQQWTIQKRESSYGTDEIDLANNLAVAHRFEAYSNVGVTHNGDFRERDIVRAAFGANRGQYIRRNQTWSVEGIAPAPTTAGDLDAHGLSDLLVASGMTEALSAGVTSTYTMSTTATAGLTMYTYRRLGDATTQQFTYGTGIRGDMVISGSIRDYVRFTFTGESNNFPVSGDTADMHGWSDDLSFIDLAAADFNLDKTGSAITYSGTQTGDDARGLFLETAAILTVGGVAIPVSDFSIPWNNTVTVREQTSAGTESGPVFITGRNVQPTFTFTTMAGWEKAADMLHADTEASSTLVVTDGLGSGGTTVTFTWPKLQVRGVDGPNDAGGLAAWSLPCQANGTWTDGIGDDEMSIVWSVTA